MGATVGVHGTDRPPVRGEWDRSDGRDLPSPGQELAHATAQHSQAGVLRGVDALPDQRVGAELSDRTGAVRRHGGPNPFRGSLRHNPCDEEGHESSGRPGSSAFTLASFTPTAAV